MEPVYINGIGILNSLGIGIEQVRTAVSNNETGIFESETYGAECGSIEDIFDLTDFTETTYHYLDSVSAFTIACVRMALKDSGRIIDGTNCRGTGLVLGSIWSCAGTMEKFQQKLIDSAPKYATPFLFSNSFPNSPAATASIEFGIKGYNTVFSGCSNSGFMAFMAGYDAVCSSKADALFTIGADAVTRTVLDYYADIPPNDSAACILIGKDKTENSVEIAEFRIRNGEPFPEHFEGERIQIIENRIYLKQDMQVPAGTCMGGAFHCAAAYAADRIRAGITDSCRIEFTAGNSSGYCVLLS